MAGAGWALNLVSHHVGSPRGPWHPPQHFIFQTIPLAFFLLPLALVQHLCSLGDLVQKKVISALPTALFQSHLCHGVLACPGLSSPVLGGPLLASEVLACPRARPVLAAWLH